MIYNHKEASEDKYPLIMNGKQLELNQEQMAHLIKKKMQGDLAVQKLCEHFEISLDNFMDKLNIEIGDLNGRYAETDLDGIVLDKGLFDGGRFFEDEWFVLLHESVHLCSRIKEDQAYMNDPEEVLGFTVSIATELARGTDIDRIWNLVYPRIEFHFHNESDSREFFLECIQKAKEFLM